MVLVPTKNMALVIYSKGLSSSEASTFVISILCGEIIFMVRYYYYFIHVKKQKFSLDNKYFNI